MTKKQLLEKLEPFSEDMEVMTIQDIYFTPINYVTIERGHRRASKKHIKEGLVLKEDKIIIS